MDDREAQARDSVKQAIKYATLVLYGCTVVWFVWSLASPAIWKNLVTLGLGSATFAFSWRLIQLGKPNDR
jgi:hypothetical protein